MPKILKNLCSEPLIISFLCLLVMFLNIIPFLVRLYNSTPDKGFAGVQFYSLDYSIYLGHFKEGAKCQWLVHDKHTTEPQAGFILRREYILWGLLTGCLLHLPIVYVYQSARIFGGFLLLFLMYLLIRQIFPDKKNGGNKWLRVFAFTLCTLVAGFPKYVTDPTTGKIHVDLYTYWFTEIDASQRFATLFHYLLGNSLLIGSLLLFIQFVKKLSSQKELKINPKKFLIHSSGFLIPIILVGWAAALIHPSTFVIIYLMFALYIIFGLFILLINYIKSHHPDHSIIYQAAALLLFVVTTAPVALILRNEVNRFPWNEIAKWDKASIAPIDFKEYIMAIGPVFFLGLLGMVHTIIYSILLFLKNRPFPLFQKTRLLLLTFPAAVFLVGFKLWPYFADINRLRFFQVPIFIPFGIFSALFLNELAKILSAYAKKILPKLNSVIFQLFAFCFLLFALIYVTFPAFRFGVWREANMFPKGDWLMYPDKNLMQGIDWLDKNTKPEDVVIAGFQASQYIPGFSGNFVYYAHPWSTVNYDQKGILENKFFSTAMSPEDAKKFLSGNNIKYVFYSYNEQAYGGNLGLYKNFLQAVYQTPQVVIYKFHK